MQVRRRGSVSSLWQFARPGGGCSVHLRRIESTSPDTVYAVSTLPHVLHLLQGSKIKCTFHVEEAIVDVASFDGSIAIAGDRGSIWLVPWPTLTDRSITLCSRRHDNLHHGDVRDDVVRDDVAALGQSRHQVRANRKRSLDSTSDKGQPHVPILHIPGVRSISCHVDDSLSVVVFSMGVLAPTAASVLSPRRNKLAEPIEYADLEGEMPTCMLYVSKATASQSFFDNACDSKCDGWLVQGDVDGRVRVVAVDVRKAVLSAFTLWSFKDQAIQQLLAVSSDAIAVLGSLGRLVVLGALGRVLMDVQLHFPVDSIVYHSIAKKFVYVARGQCYAHALSSSSSAALHHIPRDAKRVVACAEPSRIGVLSKLCRLFTTVLEPEGSNDRASVPQGSDKALQMQVAKITRASADMTAAASTALSLSASIHKMNSTRRFLQFCQVQDVRKYFHCKVSVTNLGRESQAYNGVLELSMHVNPKVAPLDLVLTDWNVLVVLRERSKSHQYTFPWRDSLSEHIRLDAFELFAAGAAKLEVHVYLVYDDRPCAFHYTVMATSLNALQGAHVFEEIPWTDEASFNQVSTQYAAENSTWWKRCHSEYCDAAQIAQADISVTPPTVMSMGVLLGKNESSVLAALLSKPQTMVQSTLNGLTISRVDRRGNNDDDDPWLVSVRVSDSSTLATMRANIVEIFTQDSSQSFGIASPAPNAREWVPAMSALGFKWVVLQGSLASLDLKSTSQAEVLWLVGQILTLELDLSSQYWSARKLITPFN
ncbi:hypothetical protein H257_16080 [Aphanomyces astaci]|uniref:Uncharacterized protein n=1 Tax=Aphanomyces astaci TaxID=112090 RepID=W4FMC5_APHAT|nr:hypothetical protein H257_16080 [Aphanomyces astaci]ETV67853.1 hypothetical protein H257_16080 [Aphanomyces astaci]|eukprot:XP_009842711.1 hypothetical protein H257_16080 [Aphanomyces astaci]